MREYRTTYLVQIASTGDTLPSAPEYGEAALRDIAIAIEMGTAFAQLEGIEEFDENGESLGGVFRSD